MATTVIQEIDYNIVWSIWNDKLWPGRETIRPVSSMTYYREENLQVYNLEYSKPVFLGLYLDNDLVGVNSGHIVNRFEYRSRGLWVSNQYRRQGIGATLLNETIKYARQRGCKYIWSFPREQSLSVYTKVGFVKVSEWINQNVEFGPNCYVRLDL